MAIQAGQRLGPYEILSAIGAGGMGEVYRARDTRLDRTVAIKILPDHLAGRAELRERFEREARTIASLNHPHICTLYDIGHQAGTDYLVMEYLEGETLAERVKKGPLPLDQVLRYAIEISDALDKAHRKGITHRDLKPGNILLTKSGAKLLDFGLAKLRQEATPVAPLSQRPTAESAMTAEGTILGTLQYMAPEQVEGKTTEIDARTDIFAFGAVVYEMATGKKAFEGKTQASLIAKILETEPAPMSSLQPMTPPALDRLAKKCLAKEPEKRWQDASDICDQLKWIAEDSTPRSTASAVPARSPRIARRWVVVAALACILAAGIGAFAVLILRPKPSSVHQLVARTVINLPSDQQPPLAPDLPVTVLALSPDGRNLVYMGSDRGGRSELYLRPMDSPESRPIPGTEVGFDPFFSPDGQWLGFVQGTGTLRKVSINGGAAVTLGSSGLQAAGGSWASQGAIVFGGFAGNSLQQISDRGGSLQPLTHLEKGDVAHRWPEVLPGGKAVVFDTGGEAPQIAVYSLASAQKRNLGLAGPPLRVFRSPPFYARFDIDGCAVRCAAARDKRCGCPGRRRRNAVRWRSGAIQRLGYGNSGLYIRHRGRNSTQPGLGKSQRGRTTLARPSASVWYAEVVTRRASGSPGS